MVKHKIMIVEDEGIVSIDIRNILSQMGYDVSAIAFSGEEAIAKAQETRPDLVLMDIGLKGSLDGVAAAERIHRNLNIPIIFLTGFADNRTFKKAQVAEPVGYITKPINEDELQKSIEDALHKQ